MKKILNFLWKAGLVLALLFLAFIGAVYLGFFGRIPNEKDLLKLEQAQASLVLDRGGALVGKFFDENRTQIEFEDLPEALLQALVATEDARFWDHKGIDYRAYVRVVLRSILLADRSGGGGSTLSQQLAKNLFGRADYGRLSMGVNKVREAIIATRLERVYSKEEIITLYLNTVSFGESVFGIETAAQRYFSKQPKELKTEECAVLVGLLKANTAYNPRLHPERAKQRRNVVLSQMARYDYLTAQRKDSLQQLPLVLRYNDLERSGTAGYFLNWIKPQVADLLKSLGEDHDINRDGLVIHTTLSKSLQQLAEQAMTAHLVKLQNEFDRHWGTRDPWDKAWFKKALNNTKQAIGFKESGLQGKALQQALEKKTPMHLFHPDGILHVQASVADSLRHYQRLLSAGFIALSPTTGEVLAWCGGPDARWMPYDHVLSRRQAASTFKPFVYAAALEQGIDPCDRLGNEVQTYDDLEGWTPTNANQESGGNYSMRGALKNSVNIPTINLLFKAGIGEVIKTAHAMGIESDLPSVPSLGLGVASVSLYEMARAYAPLANGGYRITPFAITKITTADGRVLWKAPEPVPTDDLVIKKETALLVRQFLQAAVNEGTGTALRNAYGITQDVAGKTGTSQNYADGWFLGFTPNLLCGAWVGGETPNIRFRTGSLGAGSHLALPIVGKVLQNVESSPYLRRTYCGYFPALPDSLVDFIDCPDYEENDFLDDLQNLFDGKSTSQEEKEEGGLLDWLFGKKKK